MEGCWENNLLNGLCIVTDADGHRYKQRCKLGYLEAQKIPTCHSEQVMLKLLSSSAPPEWKPDEQCGRCNDCKAEFSVFTRVKKAFVFTKLRVETFLHDSLETSLSALVVQKNIS